MASQRQPQGQTQVGPASDREQRICILIHLHFCLPLFFNPSYHSSFFKYTQLFQSFKRKPGQADNERSTGDYNERVNKRLRTVESSQDRTQDSQQSDAQQESDLYEHIKQGETAYDTQTYGQ